MATGSGGACFRGTAESPYRFRTEMQSGWHRSNPWRGFPYGFRTEQTAQDLMVHNRLIYLEKLERETRLELATSTLARLRSTN